MTIILEEKHEKIFKNMVEHNANLKILLETFIFFNQVSKN